MSVVGWKKKKQLFWLLLGAGGVGIPLLIGVVALFLSQMQLRREVSAYRQKEAQQVHGAAYCLKSEKKPGEIIRQEDLAEMTFATEEEAIIPTMNLKDLTGKYCKTTLAKGSIVTKELLSETEVAGKDIRRNTFTQIFYSEDLKKGDYADIRISFPTGEDFIVARHKQILALGAGEEEGSFLTFSLSEAELLRISSAFVDIERYEGTRIYAIAYMDSFQEASQITYPINTQVYELLGWDPNVVETDEAGEITGVSREETLLREALEKNLSLYAKEEAFTVDDGGALHPEAAVKESGSTALEPSEQTKEFFPEE